jgi:hypothetical protein
MIGGVATAMLQASDLLRLKDGIDLDESGSPRYPLAFVDLASLGATPAEDLLADVANATCGSSLLLVGTCRADQVEVVRPIADAFCLTLVGGAQRAVLPEPYVGVADLDLAQTRLESAVMATPRAAVVLGQLLRMTAPMSVGDALVAESVAYSMLLAGAEFAAWRAGRAVRDDPGPVGPAVLVERADRTLTVTLNRPARHNAFGRWVRDEACEALDIALADSTIDAVTLNGAGPSFCSGGDIDEFGSQADVAAGHLIRLERSVGWRLHRLSRRVTADVHGACVGAGLELPAFCGRVRARPDAWFCLPELSMGLIPGAGGTVSLPRRIGRWRTAWLALTGERIDRARALEWGVVDEPVDG